jgi:hypothetical protein
MPPRRCHAIASRRGACAGWRPSASKRNPNVRAQVPEEAPDEAHPVDPSARREAARAPPPLGVEGRALTVALGDRLAPEVRARLGLGQAELPLAKTLEAGAWHAGRATARALRPDGRPPITIESDGTVF